MSTESHELDGPVYIKAGRTMGNVVEFYGVLLQGRLLLGNDGPRRFESIGEAGAHYEHLISPGEMSQSVRRR